MKELTITLTRLHTGRYITIEARVVDDHHYPETSVFERLEDALKYIEGSMLRDQVEAKLAGDPIGMVEQLHQYGQAIPFNERTYQEMKAYFAESAPKLITKGKKP